MSIQPLPPRPSLASLRKQARQLHQAHQRGDAQAHRLIAAFFPKLRRTAPEQIPQAEFALQDALLVVARQYGFPSWARLKQHVEALHPIDPSAAVIEAHQVTPDWLTQRLRHNGHLPHGAVSGVKILQRDAPRGGLQRLGVAYSPEAPASLPGTFLFKRKDGGDGLREADFYRTLAPAMPAPPTPLCYDIGVDHDAGSYTLLADPTQTHYLAQRPADLGQSDLEPVVDALAQIQAHWWDQDDLAAIPFHYPMLVEGASPEAIQRSAAATLNKWIPEFAAHCDGLADREWRPLCTRAATVWPRLYTSRREQGGLTLTHTNFHPHVFLLPRPETEGTPLLYDWGGYAYAPGVYSLAHLLLTCGHAPQTTRALEAALLPRYHAGLAAAGIDDYSLEDCRADYRLSIIGNFDPFLMHRQPDFLRAALDAFAAWDCAELLS